MSVLTPIQVSCVASTASVIENIQARAVMMISLKFTLCHLAGVCNCKAQKKKSFSSQEFKGKDWEKNKILVQIAAAKHFHQKNIRIQSSPQVENKILKTINQKHLISKIETFFLSKIILILSKVAKLRLTYCVSLVPIYLACYLHKYDKNSNRSYRLFEICFAGIS